MGFSNVTSNPSVYKFGGSLGISDPGAPTVPVTSMSYGSAGPSLPDYGSLMNSDAYKNASADERLLMFKHRFPEKTEIGALAEHLRPLSPDQQVDLQRKMINMYGDYQDKQGAKIAKYKYINDIISNLGSAARSAFGGYSDPNALARMAEGVATSYNNALQASAPLTQLGQGIPSHTYYKV